MSFIKMLVYVPDSSVTMTSLLGINTTANQFSMSMVEKLIGDLRIGCQSGVLGISTGAVQASGKITLSSFVATDTITVNGRVYTGRAVPSGAQEFLIGIDDTATAANFVSKLNADTNTAVYRQVIGTSAAAIVTVTATNPGIEGNLMTLAISAHGSVSTAVAGGTDGNLVYETFGSSLNTMFNV